MSARNFTSRISSAFGHIKLERKQRAILNCLERNGSMNRRRIAALTKIEINSVCGRVDDLREMGLVEIDGMIKCPVTGRMTEAVRVKPLRSRI